MTDNTKKDPPTTNLPRDYEKPSGETNTGKEGQGGDPVKEGQGDSEDLTSTTEGACSNGSSPVCRSGS
jgi:hypothetical protein